MHDDDANVTFAASNMVDLETQINVKAFIFGSAELTS